MEVTKLRENLTKLYDISTSFRMTRNVYDLIVSEEIDRIINCVRFGYKVELREENG